MPIYNLHFEIFRNNLKCVPGCFHISRTKVYKSVFVMHGQQYIRTNSLYMFKIIYTNDLFYLLSILKRYLHGLTLNHCLGISSFFSYTKSMSITWFLNVRYILLSYWRCSLLDMWLCLCVWRRWWWHWRKSRKVYWSWQFCVIWNRTKQLCNMVFPICVCCDSYHHCEWSNCWKNWIRGLLYILYSYHRYGILQLL